MSDEFLAHVIRFTARQALKHPYFAELREQDKAARDLTNSDAMGTSDVAKQFTQPLKTSTKDVAEEIAMSQKASSLKSERLEKIIKSVKEEDKNSSIRSLSDYNSMLLKKINGPSVQKPSSIPTSGITGHTINLPNINKVMSRSPISIPRSFYSIVFDRVADDLQKESTSSLTRSNGAALPPITNSFTTTTMTRLPKYTKPA